MNESSTLWQKIIDWWAGNQQSRLDNDSQQIVSQGLNELPDDIESASYLVLDEANYPLDTHFTYDDAFQQWQELTDSQGTIVELESLEDITPHGLWDKLLKSIGIRKKSKYYIDKNDEEDKEGRYLTRKQIAEIKGAMKSANPNFSIGTDPSVVMHFIEILNSSRLPVVDAAKKIQDKAQKYIEVKKKRHLVRKVKQKVVEQVKTTTTKTRIVKSPVPADDFETRRYRRVRDLRSLARPLDWAMPRDVLARKMSRRELPVLQHLAEDEFPETVTNTIEKEVIVDEPYTEEYTEQVAIDQEPDGQLLFIVTDVSGSMMDKPINAAAAVAATVVGANLDNKSQYFFMPFASTTGNITFAKDLKAKKQLIRTLIELEDSSLGGGTNILEALRVAAREVRKIATKDTKPEILLITDGGDFITEQDIYDIIGSDIQLHTVCVGSSNPSLASHSSTYTDIEIPFYGDEQIRVVNR